MARFAYWQLAVFVAVVLTLLTGPWHYRSYVTVDRVSKSPDCSIHGFQPYNGSRRVFDMALMANELDFLEIRLNTLNETVDYFVLVESPTTFTGVAKRLYLKENWDRFRDFHHKIIHHVVEDQIDSPWSHEYFLRNYLLTAAKDGNPEEGDVLLVSDLDEIPRPEIIDMLRHCSFPTRVTLQSRFFYYSYQWKHWRFWDHPQATTYRGEETISPQNLRAFPGEVDSADVWEAGWHCSSCFRTIKQVQDKLEGFSHAPEWNTEENRNPRTIIDRYRYGLDLYGRPEEEYKAFPTDDVPLYVKKHSDRFKYLLDRTGETAEFEDAAEMLG